MCPSASVRAYFAGFAAVSGNATRESCTHLDNHCSGPVEHAGQREPGISADEVN